MKLNISHKYLLFGVVFGACFPIAAAIILYTLGDGSFDLEGDFLRQDSGRAALVLFWIICSAPFFLGLFAWVAGTKQLKIDWTNRNLKERIRAKVESIREANRALRNEVEERKKKEAELLEAKNAAEEGVKAKDQFLSNMSHEIRTPMNGILGMADTLLNTDLTGEQRGYLSAIDYSAKNLLVIINDILDLSKINAEKLEFEKVNFKIEEVIQSVTHTLNFKASEKGIAFNFHVDENVPEVVCGDPVRFSQILMNIAGNAVKFTEKGAVDVLCHLKESTDRMHRIFVEVKDTGIGIPESMLGSIFETFTQANVKIASKYGGTGLGLPISKKLIELHNGELQVRSEEGKGSVFSFTLDYGVAIEEEGVPEPRKKMDVSTEENARVKILLVEDNEINQMVANSFLSRYGFKIVVANNGREAIDKFGANDFDLILMDVQMPEMDGLEATKFIRSQFTGEKQRVKIMAMTASVLKQEIDKCFEAGMDDYVAKPFMPKELYEKIISLVYSNDLA